MRKRYRRALCLLAAAVLAAGAFQGVQASGELDGQADLTYFARTLRDSALLTIEDGIMTPDLAKITIHPNPRPATSLEYIRAVRARMEGK